MIERSLSYKTFLDFFYDHARTSACLTMNCLFVQVQVGENGVITSIYYKVLFGII